MVFEYKPWIVYTRNAYLLRKYGFILAKAIKTIESVLVSMVSGGICSTDLNDVVYYALVSAELPTKNVNKVYMH